jgi:hypothetical protein
MALTEFQTAQVEMSVSKYIESKRPPKHIREEVDLAYRIEDQSIVVYEIRARFDNPAEKIDEFIAKATYVQSAKHWKVFWQRADLKWHSYQPAPIVKDIQGFIDLLEEDSNACFWG